MDRYDDAMDIARMCIERLPPDDYTIGEIFGELWRELPDHTRLGRHFKKEVLAGRVERVKWVERKSDNNQLYRIV